MASTVDGLLPQSSTSTSNINPFLYGTLQEVLTAAKGQVNTPYQAYSGQRVAEFSPDELTAQAGVRNAQGMTMPTFNQATGFINQGAQGLAGVLNQNGFTQDQINKYLNPYTQNVVDSTTNNMLRANQIQQNQLRSNTAGAYGGSRQAILEAENDRNMQDSLGTVTGNLMSQGYTSALEQLNKDRSATMDAARGLVSSGSTLGETATAQQASNYKDINALAASGSDQRDLAQTNLDLSYQDFLNQKNYSKDQLAWLNSMLSGVDLNNFKTGQSDYSQPVREKASGLQNALGAASSIGGIIQNLFQNGFAKGGQIKAYAEGGKVEGGEEYGIAEDLYRKLLEALIGTGAQEPALVEAATPTNVTEEVTPKKSQISKVLKAKANEVQPSQEEDQAAQLNRALLERVMGNQGQSIPVAQPVAVPQQTPTPTPEVTAQPAAETPSPNMLESFISKFGNFKEGTAAQAFQPNPLLNIGLEILASEPDPYNPMGQYAKATSSALEKYEQARKSRIDEAKDAATLDYNARKAEQDRQDTLSQKAIENRINQQQADTQRYSAENAGRLSNARISALMNGTTGVASEKNMIAKINTLNKLLENPELPEQTRQDIKIAIGDLTDKLNRGGSSLVDVTDEYMADPGSEE